MVKDKLFPIILIPICCLGIILMLGLVSCAKSNSIPTTKATDENPLERIYNIDPYRKYIGVEMENHAFIDAISKESFELKDFKDKVIILESFSVGCPACAEGIGNYNQIYDKYGDKVQIIYLNINQYDTEQDILNIKQTYNGRDWKWIKYSPELYNFLMKYEIIGNDITYIIKDGKVVYADSLSVPVSRIENALSKVI